MDGVAEPTDGAARLEVDLGATPTHTGRMRWRIPPRPALEASKRLRDAVRRYFDTRQFLEVETPIAVPSPGMEPHLRALATTWNRPGHPPMPLYLHTSPEYAMKRVVGRGYGSIYQLARVFRDGEWSATHLGEFTMLEWYRQPGTLADLMDDTEALVRLGAEAVGAWSPKACVRLTVSEAFVREGLPDPITLAEAEFMAKVREAGLRTADDDTWSDVFFRAFMERVEPSFEPDDVTIISGYPASMAALARLDPDDLHRALRFEVFLGSLELANAFAELSDPVEQRTRFESEQKHRAENGEPVYPIDEALLNDLPGLDGCAGIALGLDRLLMKCLGQGSVQGSLLCWDEES